MRLRVARARVGRLATVSADGQPHVVPVCFVLDGDLAYSAVDAKPKRSPSLRRTSNIEATGTAALLVDEYSDDWERLWWVRGDARAHVLRDGAARQPALAALAAKYPQYQRVPPPGPVLALEVWRWSAWAADE